MSAKAKTKRIRYKATAFARIEETWVIDVAEDVEVTSDNVLDLVERGAADVVRVNDTVIGDEHEREYVDDSLEVIPGTFDHEPDLDEDSEGPGDWCRTCEEQLTWLGPGIGDYIHVDDKENR